MPRQVFTHMLQGLAGWFDEHAIQFIGKVSASVTYRDADGFLMPWPGTVVHTDPNTAFDPKAGASFLLGAKNSHMPIYLGQWRQDPDVVNPGDVQTDAYGWASIMREVQSGLVAVGGYEIATTEYDKTQGVTFKPGDKLHAPTVDQITSGTDYSMAGKIYNRKGWPGGANAALTAGTDAICGIVSRGVSTTHLLQKQSALAFWTYFQPGTEA
jgi:hypothetical protein